MQQEEQALPVYKLGADIGSTTIKLVVVNERSEAAFTDYRRHFSDIRETLAAVLAEALAALGDVTVAPVMTGSGGLALSGLLGLPFEQEVIAGSKAISALAPETDVAIELGGEDAKITYFGEHSLDQRMNNTCAGGTGAFIDQMATLLETDAAGLNELAGHSKIIHPIASRCGVFAKTDIQPLINEGASREDIAASIFQAVVNQTIGGLSCGKPIRGKVAFLGGPLYFLDNLRHRFIQTLNLKPDEIIFPGNSQLFVAAGAALLAEGKAVAMPLSEITRRLKNIPDHTINEVEILPRLFQDEAELNAFRERHGKAVVPKGNLADYRGPLFVGIDSGSTTTKAVCIGRNSELLYSFYSHNKGNPVLVVRELIEDIYNKLPAGARIAGSASTGYGEHLIKAAFKLDMGEVETVAHYKAADTVLPGVEFILDIGGQDMKCLTVRDGAIHDILLNEACSAGCGSFLETFARSLHLDVGEFSRLALTAPRPVELGTRCTVFMNSRVKQAQKEGASVADISAGLSYSVIKNALYKVIRLKSVGELPEKIIVQGGTFNNEAVLCAFEKLTGRQVARMDIAGLMGAYGAALLARERMGEEGKSSFITPAELAEFSVHKSIDHCKRCGNQCRLLINTFADGRHFISGNRCEKGAQYGKSDAELTEGTGLPNLYQYKYERVFDYKPLPPDKAPRGTVGIARALNCYENYPFWHTFFTGLGFSVVLSPPSSAHLYRRGLDSIPSESACFPAKLAHGHIEYLIGRKVDRIFYPSVTYEWKEFEYSGNNYNCPVVSSYSEVIRGNMDSLKTSGIPFHAPFISFNHLPSMVNVLTEEFAPLRISKGEIKKAVASAWKEMQNARADIRAKGAETVAWLKANGKRGIVLSGRPYHIDPGINHGIDKIVVEEGLAVLTEDSVAHLGEGFVRAPLRVVDQWSYHSRLYAAAAFVANCPQLELVQFTSFGCGLDALTVDQVAEILEVAHKTPTLIKIDEGTNLGAARIRLRSLKAAMEERVRLAAKLNKAPVCSEDAGPCLITPVKHSPFKEGMRENYTILAPQMSPMHFSLLEAVFHSEGYNLKVLETAGKSAVDHGLRFVHNDACYPCTMVVGQMIDALLNGGFDLNRTALIISQTGGQCRATNYISLIRKALRDAGCQQVPVISLNASGLEENPGFNYSFSMLKKAVMAILYGDLLMRVLYRTRPYELVAGSADALHKKWEAACCESLQGKHSRSVFAGNARRIVADFDALPLRENLRKPKIGVVGEILVKFHPGANNDLVGNIEAEGGEAVVPDLMDFFLYCGYGALFGRKHYGGALKSVFISEAVTRLIEWLRDTMRRALSRSERFQAPPRLNHMAKLTDGIASLGNQAGEGWLLTAEMIELLETGVPNIVCVQPFACLPNHITGRGMLKPLKERYPTANIVAIDYDPGVSEVNQINRLKLMMSVAHSSLQT